MTDPDIVPKTRQDGFENNPHATRPTKANVETPADSESAAPPATERTPEEQMALFEEDLKENDWGHQPC